MKHLKILSVISASPIQHTEFRAFKRDGSLKPGIIKAHIVRDEISFHDLNSTILDQKHNRLKVDFNGTSFELIIDPDIESALVYQDSVPIIISMQYRSNGKHTAVARIEKSKQLGDDRANRSQDHV